MIGFRMKCNIGLKWVNMKASETFGNKNPAGNYMFKVNYRNTRTRCEICSKLTIKIPERRHGIVNAGWEAFTKTSLT